MALVRGLPKIGGVDQRTLVARLQRNCPSRWPDIWGAIYVHRAACLREVMELVDEMLEDPTLTRSQLRRELSDALKIIKEWGP